MMVVFVVLMVLMVIVMVIVPARIIAGVVIPRIRGRIIAGVVIPRIRTRIIAAIEAGGVPPSDVHTRVPCRLRHFRGSDQCGRQKRNITESSSHTSPLYD